jgi:5'-nucleotidase (lipoprotein e(P4) family)
MKTIISILIFVLNIGNVFSQDQNVAVISENYSQKKSNLIIKEYPVLWQQTAAEYRALCYQAFNIAELRLDELVKTKSDLPMAIVTDLDETILDNSYYDAQVIRDGKEYSKIEWKKWTDKSAAVSVPGASKFLQDAAKKGFVVFYISNRDTGEVQSTLINLKKLQLPFADEAHMLFMSNTGSKESRRQIVMATYNIVMLLGDNLNDFAQCFEKKPIPERKVEVDKVKEEWGKKFIVLPNSAYGEWENAIYDYNNNLTPAQKDSVRLKRLSVMPEPGK